MVVIEKLYLFVKLNKKDKIFLKIILCNIKKTTIFRKWFILAEDSCNKKNIKNMQKELDKQSLLIYNYLIENNVKFKLEKILYLSNFEPEHFLYNSINNGIWKHEIRKVYEIKLEKELKIHEEYVHIKYGNNYLRGSKELIRQICKHSLL